MSSKIKILPTNLINRIAAGEVVERPASVVKELVENSLDAKANQIDIDFSDGGKTYISISDNGIGMSKEDLELCLLRHATSKLPDEDLFNIKFFGFRGEALPSIASVAKVKISSFSKETQEANQVYIEAGNLIYNKPSNISEGTKIEITDLFYATPARLKFLKSDRSEKAKIVDVINKFAMANPKCGFSLRENGKIILDYKNQLISDDAWLNRIGEIIGEDFQKNCVEINTKRGNAELKGFASLPTFNRSSSAEQYLFVNNRPVRDKAILGAIRGAYLDFLARDRNAIVALFLTLPADEVDVNVHPAKAEVRFRFEAEIRGLIVGAIKMALTNAGHRASNTISEQALRNFEISNSSNNFEQNYRQEQNFLSEKTANFYSGKNIINYQKNNFSSKIFAPQDLPPSAKNYISENYNQNNKNEIQPLKEYPLGVAKAQIFENYIISEAPDGLVIVDQHAAHERLTYEKMKKQFAEKSIQTQKLLIPIIIDLDEVKLNIILEKSEELKFFGIIFEKFGNKAISITEIPAIIKNDNIESLILDIISDYQEHNSQISLNEKFEHILETIACHYSVRSGRILNNYEMNSLLREMEETPFSGQCNHGRPTYIKLKFEDIEKLFGRK